MTNSLSNHICPTRLLHCCWSVELKSIPEIIVDRYGGLIFWLAMLCSMFCVPSSSAVFLSSFLAVICPVALNSPAFLIFCQTAAVANQGCSRVVIIDKQNYIQFKQDAAVLPILLNPFRKNSSSVLFSSSSCWFALMYVFPFSSSPLLPSLFLSISFRFCTALMFVWSPASGLSESSFILLWVCL
jgi:hypothetical protein